jgi:plastocyanin
MRKLVLPLTLLAVAVALPGTAGGHGTAAKTHTVKVGDDFFSPTKKTIHVKDIVKWTWVGADGKAGETVNEHTIAERDGKLKLLSPAQTSGTYKFRFKKAGKYVVICAEHPETMRTKITVKN